MSREEFSQLVRDDLFRYAGELGFSAFKKTWRWEPGFRFTVLMRACRLFHDHPLTRYGIYHLTEFFHRRACVRYGIHINAMTEIGGGLYLPHALNIVVNKRCVIGRNCNLSQGVTLGVANRGKRAGTPIIGDRVYIGPGAVVFGAIKVGNDSAIGANCVVTKDIPEKGVMVGVPGKIISHDGSKGYINLTLS